MTKNIKPSAIKAPPGIARRNERSQRSSVFAVICVVNCADIFSGERIVVILALVVVDACCNQFNTHAVAFTNGGDRELGEFVECLVGGCGGVNTHTG